MASPIVPPLPSSIFFFCVFVLVIRQDNDLHLLLLFQSRVCRLFQVITFATLSHLIKQTHLTFIHSFILIKREWRQRAQTPTDCALSSIVPQFRRSLVLFVFAASRNFPSR
jgi:hypothetical protein